MTHVTLQQAQADFPRYLEQVAHGETIIVCKDNAPVAEIRPIVSPRTTPRPLGLAQGMGQVHPSFFAHLPPDLLAAFHGDGA